MIIEIRSALNIFTSGQNNILPGSSGFCPEKSHKSALYTFDDIGYDCS